jgi:predicted enzyme related to lactoylglutathione lyase
MPRITGIGGIFFKAADPAGLARWYEQHLGVALSGDSMSIFRWHDDPRERDGSTVWSAFARDDDYFRSDVPYMVNYRVDDLDALLAELRAKGVAVDERTEEGEFGKFGWLTDPEGNRIELWQPPG